MGHPRVGGSLAAPPCSSPFLKPLGPRGTDRPAEGAPDTGFSAAPGPVASSTGTGWGLHSWAPGLCSRRMTAWARGDRETGGSGMAGPDYSHLLQNPGPGTGPKDGMNKRHVDLGKSQLL